ncbi:hypothetical protein V5T82_17690, partial [Magnetovibrio sp. PR-2]|uniref:hypothetical protein n=1 Tax=Magnetovibrio sp. PR-2 TaxID=3120356 RepID=UPI002FCDF054
MIQIWKTLLTLSVMAIALTACTSHAQNEAKHLADVPPPDELRFISSDSSSSTCIGDPKTPLCAVETIMACFARMDKALCGKVGVKGKVYLGKYVETV